MTDGGADIGFLSLAGEEREFRMLVDKQNFLGLGVVFAALALMGEGLGHFDCMLGPVWVQVSKVRMLVVRDDDAGLLESVELLGQTVVVLGAEIVNVLRAFDEVGWIDVDRHPFAVLNLGQEFEAIHPTDCYPSKSLSPFRYGFDR